MSSYTEQQVRELCTLNRWPQSTAADIASARSIIDARNQSTTAPVIKVEDLQAFAQAHGQQLTDENYDTMVTAYKQTNQPQYQG